MFAIGEADGGGFPRCDLNAVPGPGVGERAVVVQRTAPVQGDIFPRELIAIQFKLIRPRIGGGKFVAAGIKDGDGDGVGVQPELAVVRVCRGREDLRQSFKTNIGDLAHGNAVHRGSPEIAARRRPSLIRNQCVLHGVFG